MLKRGVYGVPLNAPSNVESRHPGLISQVSDESVVERFLRWRLVHFVVVILRVLVVSHPNKLLISVRSRQDDRGDSEDVLVWNFGRVWGARVELE